MPKTYGTPGPRLIMPTICTSVPLASCSVEAQLLFDRLITQADDQGRLQGEPRIVAALCMPLVKSASERTVSKWLDELAAPGLILRYESSGRQYIQLAGWWDNQGNPRRAYPSRHPAPDGWDDRVKLDGSLPPDSPVSPQIAADRRGTPLAGAPAPVLPVPSLPVPPQPDPAARATDEEANDPWRADEAEAVDWLRRHKCQIREGDGYHVRLVTAVERHGVNAIVGQFDRLLRAGTRDGDIKGFLFAAIDLLDAQGRPNVKELEAEERRHEQNESFRNRVEQTLRENRRRYPIDTEEAAT